MSRDMSHLRLEAELRREAEIVTRRAELLGGSWYAERALRELAAAALGERPSRQSSPEAQALADLNATMARTRDTLATHARIPAAGVGRRPSGKLTTYRTQARKQPSLPRKPKPLTESERLADELSQARRNECARRTKVFEAEQRIREWPKQHHTLLLRMAAAVLNATAAITLLVLTDQAFAPALFGFSAVMFAVFAPSQYGYRVGGRAHYARLVEDWRSKVDAHGEALGEMRWAESQVPVHVAFPELHPEAPPELPAIDS